MIKEEGSKEEDRQEFEVKLLVYLLLYFLLLLLFSISLLTPDEDCVSIVLVLLIVPFCCRIR